MLQLRCTPTLCATRGATPPGSSLLWECFCSGLELCQLSQERLSLARPPPSDTPAPPTWTCELRVSPLFHVIEFWPFLGSPRLDPPDPLAPDLPAPDRPKFRFFFPSRPIFAFSVSLLVSSLNFGSVPQMCTFGVREPKQAHLRVPAFEKKKNTKIQREDTQRERETKSENGVGEGKKSEKFWASHSGPHLGAPTLLGPTFSGPNFFWVWLPTLRGRTIFNFGQKWIGQKWIGQKRIGQKRS